MLGDMINKVADEYSDNVIETNTSLEEQIEYARFLKMVKGLSAKQKFKAAHIFIDDLCTQTAFEEIEKINKLIDAFFSKNKIESYAEIRERILNLPEDRILHYKDQRILDLYEKYRENLYKFALKSILLGDKSLFSLGEVRNTVVEKVREDLRALKNDTSISRKLWLYAQNYADKASAEQLLNPDLLMELYKYKCGIVVDNVTIRINNAEKEVKELKATLVDNKKKRVSLGRRIVAATLLKIAILTAPLSLTKLTLAADPGIAIEVEAHTLDGIKTAEEGTMSSNRPEFKDALLDEYIGTNRRYVTVFSDTVDNSVKVGVYDYTDSDLSDEQLQAAQLDSDKLIYEKQLDESSIKRWEGKDLSHLYGVYTGSAHRDISHVDYKHDSDADFAMYVFALLVSLGLTIYSYDTEKFAFINRIKDEYKETGKITKENLEKLKKLLNELEILYKQQEFNNSVDSLDTTPVEEELNNLKRPMRA